ncbi:XRE family transcriptional regulator [Limosilactobacillus fermentum]|uniref:helix-turn-helix domain-containing protein n=1 Tax=Limosilactobacillus fermentum TaxID=1613 RepID=UPI0010767CCB|nr:helix-turn-helix transcriptional regulator [Limosilactobacillus fermentum]TFZ15498.1 XRE family transcriptional regulator [Limosilactobacillus fermentum]
MSDFSKKITALREDRGWTKTYVAKKLGISSMQTYANYEYGRREPDFETAAKIADLYNVTTDYLLGRPAKEKTASDEPLTENQKLVAYSIDPDISDEERQDIIELVKIAMKNRRRI